MAEARDGDAETLRIEQYALLHAVLRMVHVQAEERDGHHNEEQNDGGSNEVQFFHTRQKYNTRANVSPSRFK